MELTREQFVKGSAGVAVGIAGMSVLGTGIALADEAASGDVAADGTYETSAQGRNGLVYVTTTISDGKISSVEVTESSETDVYTDNAIPELCASIVEHNSYAVDGISSCTVTSSAIKYAVETAVKEAGGSDAVYGIKPEVIPGEDEEITVDVAIIGAGLSGIMAATRAGKEGARVALIDKTCQVGGCSLQSFAMTVYAGEDTISAKMASWIDEQMYMVDPTLIRTYLENSEPSEQFINSYNESGITYYDYSELFGMALLCDYTDRHKVYDEMLEKEVIGNGGTIYYDTTVKSLTQDASGAVVGVKAQKKDGSNLTVNARAVIIATGGYGGDTARVEENTGYNVVCGCLYQDKGEGIDMAWAIGAKQPMNIGSVMLHQTLASANLPTFPYFQRRMPMILGYTMPLLDVNPSGVRFRNEEWCDVATAAAGTGAFQGGITYAMLDQSIVDKLMTGGLQAIGQEVSPGMPPEYKPDFDIDTPWDDLDTVLQATIDGGWAFYGETIEELAANAGMDADVLQSTFDTYNAFCDAGEDKVFGKTPEYLTKYEYGPYYLVQICYNQLGTTAGLVINTDFQVMDADGFAIPGLYSTGADCSSTLWNRNYYGNGDGVGWATVSGYAGGKCAADYALA